MSWKSFVKFQKVKTEKQSYKKGIEKIKVEEKKDKHGEENEGKI